MLQLEQALDKILSSIPPARTQSVALSQADARISAETILAPIDLPMFDNSAMDGYAVRSTDVASSSPQTPTRLTLAGKIAAGSVSGAALQPGTCIRVFTGSPIPDGADAVVMQEDTDAQSSESVLVLDATKPFENIRLRGEDIKRGDGLVSRGEKLSAGKISLLGSVGVSDVKVGIPPVVGILATGAELVEAPNPIAPGKIFESNRAALAALASGIGAQIRIFPLVTDSLDATQSALAAAFSESDIVVTSGGVSVGEMDFVKSAFESLSGRIEFWKLAIRPGKPFVFGRKDNKFLFGLPGNPVSAFVTFFLLARPAILRWQGARDVSPRRSVGILDENFLNRDEKRRHFARVKIDNEGKIRSAGAQASHMVSSLAAANALLEIPAGAHFEAGKMVSVLSLD